MQKATAHNDWRSAHRRSKIGAAFLAALLYGCQPGSTPLERLRASAEGDISAGQSIEFEVVLRPRQTMLVTARQDGFDFSLSLAGPDGVRLLDVDSPTRRTGTEYLSFVAENAGKYTVVLAGQEHPAAKGRYRVEFEALQSGSGPMRDGYRALSLAGQKFAAASSDSRSAASDAYREAIASFRRAGHARLEAEASHASAALAYHHLSDWAAAAAAARHSADIFRRLGDHRRYAQAIALEAASLTEGGRAAGRRGNDQARTDLDRAARLLEEARTINLGLNDQFSVAANLNDLGINYLYRDRFAEAVDQFSEASRLFGQLGERPRELMSLQDIAAVQALRGNYRVAANELERLLTELDPEHDPLAFADVCANSAFALAQIGDTTTAIRRYTRALEIQLAHGDPGGQARSRQGLANIYWRMGERGRALDMFLSTLPLRSAANDSRGTAITLVSIGNLYREMARLKEAESFHTRALEVVEQHGLPASERMRVLIAIAGDRNAAGDFASAISSVEAAQALDVPQDHPFRARAMVELARALSGTARWSAAADTLRKALALQAEFGASFEESQTRVMLAAALYRMERRDAALEELDRALMQLESLRIRAAGPELRASFLSARHEAYELRIRMLLENPGNDAVMQALLTAERAHARSLLDGLRSREHAIDPGDSAQLDALYEQIDGHELRLQMLAGQGVAPSDGRVLELRAETNLLRVQLGSLAGRRASRDSWTFDAGAAIDGLRRLQRQLGEEDVVLNYFLSSPASWVWAITRDDVHVFSLPDQTVIDRSADRFIAQLRNPSSSLPDMRQSGRELAKHVLQPTGLEFRRRTVIIPDGILQNVPFSALPADATKDDRKLLVDETELTIAHSLSTLDVLAQRSNARRDAARALIFADPVYGDDDPRVISSQRTNGTARPGVADAGTYASFRIPRLPATATESAGIARLLPADRVRVVTGFDASVSNFRRMAGEDYDLLHLATHVKVDRSDPGLTGLILSGLRSDGQSLPQTMQAYEIAGMNIPAALVTLSACDSSIGRDFRGEGMLGLGRAFLLAGAQNVVSTQWSVADLATSELMGRMYENMLERGAAPPSALRAAQQYMKTHDRWHHPYFWAAFVVYGKP